MNSNGVMVGTSSISALLATLGLGNVDIDQAAATAAIPAIVATVMIFCMCRTSCVVIVGTGHSHVLCRSNVSGVTHADLFCRRIEMRAGAASVPPPGRTLPFDRG